MRIVYVLTTLAVGGTERQVLAIATRMAARGHAVAIVVLKVREPNGCSTDLPVIYLNIKKNALSVAVGLRSGMAFLRAFRPDVIHSHNFHGNMLARAMRMLHGGVKLIATIHNVFEGGRLRMLCYQLSNGLVHRTTAVSAAVAERFARLEAVRREKCVVITNGIVKRDFEPDAARRAAMRAQMGVGDEFVWLSVGRVTEAKDIGNLLRAFAGVCRSDDRVRLWIAGEASRSTSAKLPETTLDAADKIRWLGLRLDVPALLDAADGFVLASAWEGMPLAVGEAMAMEKPVVATDVGGVRELVGDAGVLVRARDSGALMKAMQRVTDLPGGERAALGRTARQRIEKHFDMDAKADEWEALYRSVTE